MLVKNAKVLTEDFVFDDLDVRTESGIICDIGKNLTSDDGENVVDASGKYLLPGFIDVHTHGCMGYDTCDADVDGYSVMSEFYASCGVTSFLFTTMTFSEKILTSIIEKINEFMAEKHEGARPLGIYLEGPFINPNKKGAQSEKYISDPDVDMFNRLQNLSEGKIKVVLVAPEMKNGLDFVKNVSGNVAVSIGHTGADYDTAVKAYENGAVDTTHLFNGMPSYHHRNPGVIGAAFEKCKFAELICDGVHVHENVIRNTFASLGGDRVVLISDSVRAAGMPDGDYTLGGQDIVLKSGKAFLPDGTIAGSAGNLGMCVKHCINCGIKPEDAIKAATLNPARLIGLDDKIGSIACGKFADLILVNEKFEFLKVL